MSTTSAERLAEVFVELADTLVVDYDVMEFLHLLSGRVTEVTGATAVGLLMADRHERLQVMAASQERVHLLNLFQLQQDEGPGRDCFHQGRPVMVTDLRSAGGRWPQFAPLAVASGLRSVHAFPLRLRDEIIGSMGLFGVEAGAMTEGDARFAQALADMATIGILQERAVHEREVLAEQLQRALGSRVVIEQANGMLAQWFGVPPAEGFRTLRTYCRNTHQRLNEVAAAIVRGDLPISDLSSGPKAD